ncbi:MAG: ABC transporter ATP-binding protein [Clostridiales bacterium]|nr:ABC transporter ATP-binding protein [Clostridiales bacterium]
MKIEISKLSKKYGEKYALRDVSLTLENGIYGLLGPNGAGKSTLMNILVGNLEQTKGSVRCDGEDIQKMGREYRSLLGYMPQQQNLYPGFSGWDFLAYMAALKGIPKEKTGERVAEVAAQVNLADELSKKLHAYSGGMRQRILLAAAIINDPALLILDEPTAGLDPRERIRIRNLISSISGNKTVIIATHVVSDVEHISREVMLLGGGQLIRKASISDLTDEIAPYVHEIAVPAYRIDEIEAAYCVSNILSDGKQARIRILADEPDTSWPVSPAIPTLEDVYLFHFQFKEEVVSNASDQI